MVRVTLLYILFGISVPLFSFAFEATSTSFKLIDPVFTITGGFATSTTYRLNQAASQPAIGTSSSPTSFRVSGGFLYFPFVTKPTVISTAGDASVDLSWTASPSQGFLGWNVSGYNVGQATISGGPYTYSASLGNVTSSTRTGLSNGATYYFVVRAEDAFTNSIATSSEVFATPVAGPVTAPTSSVSAGADGGGIIKNFLISLVAAFREPLIPCEGGISGDLNCDNKIGLQDLSILLSRAEAISVKGVSVLFSHWTESLLTFIPESPLYIPPPAVEKVISPEKQIASVSEAVGLFEKTASTVQEKEGVATPRLTRWVRMITQPLDRVVSFVVSRAKSLRNILFSVVFSFFNTVWK